MFDFVLFKVKNKKSFKIAKELAQKDIFIRDGGMCVDTLKETMLDEIVDFIRVSLHYYNTEKDIELFVDALKNIKGEN